MARKKKYFVVREGSDRAILRTDKKAAIKKRDRLRQFSGNKKVYIFVSEEKLCDETELSDYKRTNDLHHGQAILKPPGKIREENKSGGKSRR